MRWAALLAGVLAACSGGRADTGTPAPRGELRVSRKPVEDVFLLTGDLRAVRSVSLNTPRGEGELQIRWMVEDGSEVKAGDRLVEFDAARLIQTIEERRLKLRQAENDRESRERSAAAEAERKRVAVDKAEVEAEKAHIDAVVPRELRPAVEWRRFQATWQDKQAALEKARLERETYVVSSRGEIATARAAEEKARRDVAAAEKALASTSLVAPKAGFFLVGNFWQWGPGLMRPGLSMRVGRGDRHPQGGEGDAGDRPLESGRAQKVAADGPADLTAVRAKIDKAKAEGSKNERSLGLDRDVAKEQLDRAETFKLTDEGLYSRHEIIESQLDRDLFAARADVAGRKLDASGKLSSAERQLGEIDASKAQLKVKVVEKSPMSPATVDRGFNALSVLAAQGLFE